MSERSLSDLIRRMRAAQKNLGPRNPYRLLLGEAIEAIYAVVRQYGDVQEAYAAASRVAAGVAGDRGAGSAAPEDVGGDAGGAVTRSPDPDPCVITVTDGTATIGYGHGV